MFCNHGNCLYVLGELDSTKLYTLLTWEYLDKFISFFVLATSISLSKQKQNKYSVG